MNWSIANGRIRRVTLPLPAEAELEETEMTEPFEINNPIADLNELDPDVVDVAAAQKLIDQLKKDVANLERNLTAVKNDEDLGGWGDFLVLCALLGEYYGVEVADEPA